MQSTFEDRQIDLKGKMVVSLSSKLQLWSGCWLRLMSAIHFWPATAFGVRRTLHPSGGSAACANANMVQDEPFDSKMNITFPFESIANIAFPFGRFSSLHETLVAQLHYVEVFAALAQVAGRQGLSIRKRTSQSHSNRKDLLPASVHPRFG